MPIIIVIMAMTLLTGLGTVLVLGTMTESAIAASYRDAADTFYAAEAAVEFVTRDLAAASDWDAVVAGDAMSVFVDGPADGTREVGAVTLDLTEATRDVNTVAAAGPGGSIPTYGLYAYGPFADLLPPAAPPSRIYVVVWVADLAGEGEGGAPASPVVGLVARAYGPTGARRSVAVSVARTGTGDAEIPAAVRVLSWNELR